MTRINLKTHFIPNDLFIELKLQGISANYEIYYYKTLFGNKIMIYLINDYLTDLDITDDINIFPSNYINKNYIDNYIISNISSFLRKKNKYLEDNIEFIDLESAKTYDFVNEWILLNKSVSIILIKLENTFNNFNSLVDLLIADKIINQYRSIIDISALRKKLSETMINYIDNNFSKIIIDEKLFTYFNNSLPTEFDLEVINKLCYSCIIHIDKVPSSIVHELCITFSELTFDHYISSLMKYYCLEYIKYLKRKNKNQEIYSIYIKLQKYNNPVSLFIQKLVFEYNPNNLINTNTIDTVFHLLLENIF